MTIRGLAPRTYRLAAVAGAAVLLASGGVIALEGSSGAASPASHVSACARAETAFRQRFSASGPVLCAKAEKFVGDNAQSGTTVPVAPKTPGLLTAPQSVQPVADGRVVQTSGIQQDESPGTTLTALWTDVESGMYVAVKSETPDASTSSANAATTGVIVIQVINPFGYTATGPDGTPNPTGSIAGYSGGTYPVTGTTGPVTLTSVTGTVSAGSLVASFSYAGGTGTLTAASGSIVLTSVG
jgi:hypothetical protein